MNQFHKQLDYSLDTRDANFLDKFYHSVFKTIDNIEYVEDMELQKQGIDKIFHLYGGKQILIDEKKRTVDYGDILLEEYSNIEQKKVGWLGRKKRTDYIMYIVMPTERIFVLPFFILQNLWFKYYKEWKKLYGIKEAKNFDKLGNYLYTTTNIPIPKDILFDLIQIEMGYL